MNKRRLVTAFHSRAVRRAAAVAASALALSACAPSYPPIAEPGGDARFKARIADTYRPGSPGAALRAVLAAQGFAFLDDPVGRRYSALDIPLNLPCFSHTRIDWTEDARGRIVRIQAARHSCS